MATFEELKFAQQAHQNIEGLRRDMRANAQGYLDAMAAGRPVAPVAIIASQNTNEYLRRLGWASSIQANVPRRTKLANGIVAMGLTAAELASVFTELKNAADAERTALNAAGVNTTPPASTAGTMTSAQLQAMANATLAIATHDSVWPNG